MSSPESSDKPLPTLPTEVHERIIDSFAYDPHVHLSVFRPTLLACSLVCRSWYPKSRFHLFREITLEDKLSLTLLRSSLQLNPMNGRYTEAFYAQANLASNHYSHLVPLLLSPQLLPGLTLLRLDGPMLHPSLWMSLSKFKTLTFLDLWNINFSSFSSVARIVYSLPCLSQLNLVDVSWLNPGTPSHLIRPAHAKHVHLHRLYHYPDVFSSHTMIDLVNWLFMTSSLNTLRSIGLGYDWSLYPEALQTTRKLLQACRSSLEDLVLYMDSTNYLPNCFDNISIQDYINLQFLHIFISKDDFEFLDSLSRMCAQVTFNIHTITFVFMESNYSQSTASANWSAIDTALTQSKFSKLKLVCLQFAGLKSQIDLQIFGFTPETLLPNLSARGILSMKFDWSGLWQA